MTPRFLSTRAHGLVGSMTIGAALVASALLPTKEVPASARALRLWAASTIALTALTDFEFGAVPVIPMRTHLALDAVAGPVLAAGPWLLGGATAGRRHWVPHALLGGTEFVLAFTTRTQSPYRNRRRAR